MPTKYLGPWQAGLNLSSNRDLSVFLSDKELGDAENVIYTPEGFIQPRPGFKTLLSNGVTDIYMPIPGESGSTNIYLSIIGYVDTGVNGIYALIQKTSNGKSYVYKVRDEDIGAADANIEFMGETLYGAKVTHLIVHSGFTLAVSDPDGFTYPMDTGVILFTDRAETTYILPFDLNTAGALFIDPIYKIPASHAGMVVKDRLFLFDYDKNIMWYSPAQYILDFRTDAGTIAIAPYGNDIAGQEIIEPTTPTDKIRTIEFYNNNFYIFKRNATFMFTYQTSPLTDGYLRKISDDTGAYDSTIYRENIIVINHRGVFRVENTDFIDLQTKMNFRFEFPMDHPNINQDDIFITNFNGTVLFGFRDRVTNAATPKTYYYTMNLNTGAWSRWSFDYTTDIAAPGGSFVLAQKPNTTLQKAIFVNFKRDRFVYMHWKPSELLYNYHLDSSTVNTKVRSTLYYPNVTLKTTASVGDNILRYKKLYRYYLRFYLSEVPVPTTDIALWTLSINYNHYKFDSLMNPIFGLYPAVQPFPDPKAGGTVDTAVYTRTYQVRLPQQRAREFVFELKRRFSTIAADTVIHNPDADRPIKTGYYFLLSGLWFDYQDKALI